MRQRRPTVSYDLEMVTRCKAVRVSFININDMYDNDVGKGGVWVCEAHQVQ
jgi:hypothetical protein